MPLPPEHSKLKSLLETLLAQLPSYAAVPTAYDDAVWVGARLAEILPLTLAAQAVVARDARCARPARQDRGGL